MKKNTWTSEEIKFLNDNFPTKGVKFCSVHLNYSISKINNMSYKLGLKINKDVKIKYVGKPNNMCNVNPELFFSITTKEVSYILGLMWADGFLNKTGRSYNLGVNMIKDDIILIKKTFDEIGIWNFFESKRKRETWKDQIRVVTNNKRIFNFLLENGYNQKSFISADIIISKIPENLQHYFYRGLIDGDGCFYYKKNKKSTMRQLTITSTYNQNWEYLVLLYKKLNIKFAITKVVRKKSSYSIIRISNKRGINNLGNYIYNGYEIDNIGLHRKYVKYLNIINSPYNSIKNTRKLF